nr:MAG: terminase large subunit [Lokiarchaeota virus Skoll Meg22_1214]
MYIKQIKTFKSFYPKIKRIIKILDSLLFLLLIMARDKTIIKHIKSRSIIDLWNEDGTVPPKPKTLDPINRSEEAAKLTKKTLEEIIVLPLPEKDPGFFNFCRWYAYPRFRGLYKWQKEHHELTWGAKYEMTLVPRDHGKSVMYTQKYQWAMWYHNYDILLLGWTDRRKEIALNVYIFFSQRGLIDVDKRTSPFHFKLVNGCKFDCYLISSKETLGMHTLGSEDRFSNILEEEWKKLKKLYSKDENKIFSVDVFKEIIQEQRDSKRKLWIAIDDPIDISFMKERHKEESLELHFNSTLYPIHPSKWSFIGTHKFEGDFFDFLKQKFKKDLVIYQSGTRRKDGSLLCPEKFTHPDLKTYKIDILNYKAKLQRNKIIPLLDKNGNTIPKEPKMDLAKLREHVGEYSWWSEYEQTPHPITGEVWDKITKIDLLEDPVGVNYDICFISIDRATTTKKSSSLTGCIIGLRHLKTGKKTIIHDWTDRMTLEELLVKLNMFVVDFKKKYENMRILLIVETQGGGHDFIEMCLSRRHFYHHHNFVENKLGSLTEIIPLHNTGEKLARIQDRLLAPIKNGVIQFMSTLEHSELVNEILKFPHYPKLDAIDALANAEYELQKIPMIGGEDPFLELINVFRKQKENLSPQEKEELKRKQLAQRQHRKYVFSY